MIACVVSREESLERMNDSHCNSLEACNRPYLVITKGWKITRKSSAAVQSVFGMGLSFVW